MSEPIMVFTDGAARGNPGPGGWGAVLVNPTLHEVVELGGGKPKTTNNIMELQAAIASLSYLAPTNADVVMYVDSKYVIDGITKWVYGWRQNGWKTKAGDPVKNQEEWKLLWVLSQERVERSSLTWEYVPGHSGIPGNERADRIAQDFADSKNPDLYRGNMATYPNEDIANLSGLEKARTKKKSTSNTSGKKAFCYVSMIDDVIKTHDTWAQCKERVDGKKALYRKAISRDHLNEIINEWKDA